MMPLNCMSIDNRFVPLTYKMCTMDIDLPTVIALLKFSWSYDDAFDL